MTGRLLLIEEQEILALGLQMALRDRDWEVETITGRVEPSVVDRAVELRPDCVLLDIHFAGGLGSGLEMIAPMSAIGAPLVVFTAERRRAMLAECLEAGATCWVSKAAPLDELHLTLQRAVAGDPVLGRADRAALLDELRRERAAATQSAAVLSVLSHREGLVLGALVDGLSAEEIADSHFVALSTVRSQIRSILQKLGVRSQLAAVALVAQHRDLLPRQTPTTHVRRRARGLIGCGPEFRS